MGFVLYQIYNDERFLDGIAAIAEKPRSQPDSSLFSPPVSGPDEPWPNQRGLAPLLPPSENGLAPRITSEKSEAETLPGSPLLLLRNRFEPLGTLQDEQLSIPKAKRHRSASRAANEHKGPGSLTHRDSSYYTNINANTDTSASAAPGSPPFHS